MRWRCQQDVSFIWHAAHDVSAKARCARLMEGEEHCCKVTDTIISNSQKRVTLYSMFIEMMGLNYCVCVCWYETTERGC